ncbi:MAG: NAD(P)/FAD-dependent oxidoreductase [Candidatus Kariarchaeaceae archaeon]
MSQETTNISSHEYDVVIVGGGPAGVICAITVAKGGFKVAIVDKKSREEIGNKTCGDAVDKAAYTRLYDSIGIEFPNGDEVSDPIKRMSIAAGSIDTKLSLVAPGYVVDRHILGQRLIKEAEQYGVTIIDTAPVRDIIVEDNNGQSYLRGIKYRKDGKIQELKAKFTVDASGSYAVIRKRLPDEFLSDGITRDLTKDQIWPSYREIIELKDEVDDHLFDNEIVLLYKDDFPPPGYFWIFTKGKKKLNCGIGWMKYQSDDLGSMKEGYLREMENYYPRDSYTIVKTGGGQIPVRPPFDSLVFNGGALAGDAACMVHPLTAEGHGPALDTSMHLGKTLIEALNSGIREKDALWSYNIAVSHHYAKKHQQALIMRNLMEGVGAKGLEYILKKQIFKNEEMDLVFSGDKLVLSMWEKMKRGYKLLFKPKLLLALKRVFDSVDNCEKLYNEYPVDPKDLDKWRKERNRILKVNF